MKQIKVLVIDDSFVFRELIARGISTDSAITVVGTADDPFDAGNKIIDLKPDVITCDIEMPRMNGIEFIRQLIPQYPIPAVVVSSVNTAVFDALEAGAVEFVAKPRVQTLKDMEAFIHELVLKIRIASTAKIIGRRCLSDTGHMYKEGIKGNNDCEKKLIAIGASTGGTEAIFQILSSFSDDMPGIVIVQHIPPVFSNMFAECLNQTTGLWVKEAENNDYIEKGKVLISPGDAHMQVRKVGEQLKVVCFKGEKVNGHCPSVDVLFESVAKTAAEDAVGVILTGMGYDGAKGLLSMRRKGARTIGQDEKTSVVYGMPRVALEIGAVEKQVSLKDMAEQIKAAAGKVV